MSPRPKNPRVSPQPLTFEPGDFTQLGDSPLARITFSSSPYALPWGQLRTWGPISHCRWDPQPPPPGEHPGVGVLYTADELLSCAAEVFANTRLIDTRSDAPVLQVWYPTRPLQLLDLSTNWALRNGASVSLDSASRATCRAWSRAIWEQRPGLDGLRVRSTMTGGLMTVLFSTAADSIPLFPAETAPLDDPTVHALLCELAPQIGYDVV